MYICLNTWKIITSPPKLLIGGCYITENPYPFRSYNLPFITGIPGPDLLGLRSANNLMKAAGLPLDDAERRWILSPIAFCVFGKKRGRRKPGEAKNSRTSVHLLHDANMAKNGC